MSSPYLNVSTGLMARKRSIKELYRFSMLVFLLSLFAFACNGLTAKTLTSIVHSEETNIDALRWYWRSYARILRVLSSVSGLTSLLSIAYFRWILPAPLRVKNHIHLVKYH